MQKMKKIKINENNDLTNKPTKKKMIINNKNY